jgi:AGZA family xanthine/uracil permease-like MFS transporter
MRAGTITAFAMLYIISGEQGPLLYLLLHRWLIMSLSSTVNASVLSDSGGPCVCNGGADDPICENNLEYSLCKNELRRDYVTSTSAISLIATFLMGLLANMPLGLAPGLGGE